MSTLRCSSDRDSIRRSWACRRTRVCAARSRWTAWPLQLSITQELAKWRRKPRVQPLPWSPVRGCAGQVIASTAVRSSCAFAASILIGPRSAVGPVEVFSWAVGGAGVELGLRKSPPSGGAVSYVPTLDVQMVQSTPRCVPMHGWLSGLFTGQLWRKRHPWF